MYFLIVNYNKKTVTSILIWSPEDKKINNSIKIRNDTVQSYDKSIRL